MNARPADRLAIAVAQRFDVILIDLKLPDGDGCVFVPQLAGATRRGRTPVVAVSAHALAADQQRAFDVGRALGEHVADELVLGAFRVERAEEDDGHGWFSVFGFRFSVAAGRGPLAIVQLAPGLGEASPPRPR